MVLQMNPARLKQRITLMKQLNQPNSYGEVEETDITWINHVTVWADVKFLQGRELFQASQVHNEVTAKILIRFRKDLEPNMRIRYLNRTLDIVSPPINVNEQNRYLELTCKEVI
jgi:SPP1 family predicted phage head-tail adaptor